jgi:hypothetical protein
VGDGYEAQHAADVEAAEQQKAALLAEAQTTISLWQTELQLGIISDEDKASLIAWMNYIKAVQAVTRRKRRISPGRISRNKFAFRHALPVLTVLAMCIEYRHF